MDISRKLNQNNTVITVDQALYCKLKEVVWLKREDFETVVIRLGGLHILMDYLKCIRTHMDSSGLSDLLIDSRVNGENACHVLLSGKAYNRGVQAYKLTYEALWRVYFAKVKQWQQDCNTEDMDSVQEMLCLAEKVSDALSTKDN